MIEEHPVFQGMSLEEVRDVLKGWLVAGPNRKVEKMLALVERRIKKEEQQ